MTCQDELGRLQRLFFFILTIKARKKKRDTKLLEITSSLDKNF